MKLAVVIFLIAQLSHPAEFRTSTMISQKKRIELLKQQISYEIRALRNHSSIYAEKEKDLLEDYEDFNNENLPLTPIVFSNDRKNTANLATAKMSSVNPKTDEDSTSNSPLRTNRKLKRKKQKLRLKKPLEIFYRRIYKKDILNQCLEWVHCQEMITPYLTGLKKNVSSVSLLTPKDPNVIRLIQLMRVNTSTYSRDDIYSILYQISNLKLRLFQWDVPSLNMLLNVIIKVIDRRHTFANLKHGIGELFKKWRLDFSGTSALLKQSRIIRPPCVYISDMDGSTKSPKVTKYTKPAETSAIPCEDYDECK